MHTFSDTSVHDFFVDKIIKELAKNKKFEKFKIYERIEPIQVLEKEDPDAANFMV